MINTHVFRCFYVDAPMDLDPTLAARVTKTIYSISPVYSLAVVLKLAWKAMPVQETIKDPSLRN